MTPPPQVRVTVLHPQLLDACGDEADAVALAARGRLRGLPCDVTVVRGSERVPPSEVYLLGGGGTAGVAELADRLDTTSTLRTAVAGGAVLLAVDAGLDVLGHGVRDRSGTTLARGLGMVDLDATPGPPCRGEAVTRPRTGPELPALSGWVDHALVTRLGPCLAPLAQVRVGSGRLFDDGVLSGHVVGTRMHGPVLARNPELADLVLAWATGRDPRHWEPLPPGPAERGRAARLRGLL